MLERFSKDTRRNSQAAKTALAAAHFHKMSMQEALTSCSPYKLRVVQDGAETIAHPTDYDEMRINVWIKDGVIQEIISIG